VLVAHVVAETPHFEGVEVDKVPPRRIPEGPSTTRREGSNGPRNSNFQPDVVFEAGERRKQGYSFRRTHQRYGVYIIGFHCSALGGAKEAHITGRRRDGGYRRLYLRCGTAIWATWHAARCHSQGEVAEAPRKD